MNGYMNGYIALDGNVYTWDTEPISPFAGVDMTEGMTDEEWTQYLDAQDPAERRARVEQLLNEEHK